MVNKNNNSSLIIHMSKPVRDIIRRFSLLLLFLAAILGIFITQTNSNFSQTSRAKISDILSPFSVIITAPMNLISNIDNSISSYLFVKHKNAELIEANKKLRESLIDLSGVKYENRSLKKLLNYVEKIPKKYITTNVVGNFDGPFFRSTLVGAGKKENVQVGQAVVNDRGLIGRISEVGEVSSRALLLTDLNSKIPVITSKSRERVIMSGNNSYSPELLYMSKDSQIEDGEIVITSGDGKMFPPGIHVGTIHVSDDKKYFVTPFVIWHKLEKISILSY